MKIPLVFLAGLSVILSLTGCAGGDADSSQPSPADTPVAAGDENDLTKRWGPEEMPDQEAEPLQFLYWRVDRMFEESDADGDGRMTPDEYPGLAYNFERLDTDGSGYITKKEVIDDMLPQLREQGKIP